MNKFILILPLVLITSSCNSKNIEKENVIVNEKNQEQLKSGILKDDLPVKDGVIPKGYHISVMKENLRLIYSNKDFPKNFKINGILFDNRFPVYFDHSNDKRRLKCGILAEDTVINGELFSASTGIHFDKDGKVIYLGGSYEKHIKQERINVSKIYIGRRTIDYDANLDNESGTLDGNCFINTVVPKDVLNLYGVDWLEDTVIEIYDLYPDGMPYPGRVFARIGQKIDGRILKKDSFVEYCWDRKLKKAVIGSIEEMSFDDFGKRGGGGNTCQWSLTNIPEEKENE